MSVQQIFGNFGERTNFKIAVHSVNQMHITNRETNSKHICQKYMCGRKSDFFHTGMKGCCMYKTVLEKLYCVM